VVFEARETSQQRDDSTSRTGLSSAGCGPVLLAFPKACGKNTTSYTLCRDGYRPTGLAQTLLSEGTTCTVTERGGKAMDLVSLDHQKLSQVQTVSHDLTYPYSAYVRYMG